VLKKVIIISFILLFSNSYAYSDINKEHWAYNYIKELSDKELLSGYPDKSFRPDENIKRSEFITVLAKTICPNADVSNASVHWSNGSSNILKAKNILKLEEYECFDPEKHITRLEVVKLLTRSITGFSEEILSKFPNNSNFIDILKYSNEEKRMVNILVKLNILSGYPDNSIKLEEMLTRAEATSVFYKFMRNKDKLLELFEDKSVVYEDDIATIYKENLPYELKKIRNSKESNYITTKINSIDIFEFKKDVPDKYRAIFDKLYLGEDLYSKYRVKFGEGNTVLALNITTSNKTDNYETFSGHEFLRVEFFDENIEIIDSFDGDEIERQINKNANVGEKVEPGKTWDTSVFYVINKYPEKKIRIDRDITELYDVKLEKLIKITSFNSLVIKLKEENE